MVTGTIAEREILEILREVKDPEVPALDIVELGILRKVEVSGEAILVDITPTYSGCPALHVIEEEIVAALKARGFPGVRVRTIHSPPWSTDWLTAEAKEKLRAYGIAPPQLTGAEPLVTLERAHRAVQCPYCGSSNTEEKSEFGSTACKAIHFCNGCHQPFDYFKEF